MKKELSLLVLVLILLIPIIFAEDNITESQRINNAYSCLNSKITAKTCSQLSTEEKIFSALATGECLDDLKNDESSSHCWPKSNCNIKTTAQAILALQGDTQAENWLLSKNISASGINWYLEIDTSNPASCTITYSDSSHTISIGEDKKISSSAGPCLSLSQDGYWLKVSDSCYEKNFEISCNESFISTFLFKKKDSSTFHILKDTESASAGGKINMQVKSFCFSSEGSSCDYEGTLWAAITLKYLGEDVSPYMPYLLTLASENENLFPEAFLYYLTNYVDLKTAISEKQKIAGYWDVSGDKYYDTAIALYPFQSEGLDGKEKAKSWLFEQQDSEGCWNHGNIKDTAFILYSVFPRSFFPPSTNEDCEDSGYYCMTPLSCTGSLLDDYDCSGLLKCCDTPPPEKTCEDIQGVICNSTQECSGTEDNSVSGLSAGETCCVTGSCQAKTSSTQQTQESCEANNGRCDPFGCEDNEKETSVYTCSDSSDYCCMPEQKKMSSIWIWVFSILIILTIIGFFFKDKLRMFWMRFRGNKGFPITSSKRPPRFPPTRMPSSSLGKPSIQRRILPPQKNLAPQKRPLPKKPSEMNEVLRKLKEMGSKKE